MTNEQSLYADCLQCGTVNDANTLYRILADNDKLCPDTAHKLYDLGKRRVNAGIEPAAASKFWLPKRGK